jgi:hypothetical protein
VRTAATILGLGVALLPVASAGQAAPITDPAAFVADVYRRLVASEHDSDYLPPKDIYSQRLKALFAEDDRHRGGEIGCMDFVFWVNGQDWGLTNIRVTSREVAGHPDRRLVIATFVNLGSPEEIHFDFQQIAGRWLLDDVQSVKDGRWTLSAILKCWR